MNETRLAHRVHKSANENPITQMKIQSVETFVPGHRPIDLVAFYPHQVEYYPECELETKRWFVENIQSDWVLFDVGANIGYYSILFSRLATAGRVFAFEPTDTFSMLEENLAHNGCRNVKSLKVALGMVSGAIEDNIYRNWGEGPERLAYDFSTVDELVERLDVTRLDCIKIDVDSFDFEVLIGAEQTLRRFNPWVVVELCHALSRRNQSPPEALKWLMTQGYRRAHVLEHENFVLRRSSDDEARIPEDGIFLTFENRPVVLPPPWVKDTPIENLFVLEPLAHNRGKIAVDSARREVSIEAPGPRWAFACSWPRRNDLEFDRSFIIELKMRVSGGSAGIGCVVEDFTQFVAPEIEVAPSSEPQIVHIYVEDPGAAKHLVLRNIDLAAREVQVTISEWSCYGASKIHFDRT